MPPIANNPKFKLWKARAEKEGATKANRLTTDDFIQDELPDAIKPTATEFVSTYRSAVDLPGHLFKGMLAIALFYTIYTFNNKKK